ncbi:MAG: hypothetical protein HY323_09115 [Betaproteobacteria bacterium]|nr:hypothetical protein [Betaproteobacteria bacterium]
MTLANDSILVTPGSGAIVATHLIGGKEHQVVVQADGDGHITNTIPTYFYMVPATGGAASKLYLDLFNAVGSGKIVDVRGVWAVPKTDVATGVAIALRLDLFRTSAVGTGGTAAAYKSATQDVAGGNITPSDTNNAALPAQITARHLPTGGATIAEWIFSTYVPGEEVTTSMSYITQFQNLMPVLFFGQKWTLREGQGLLLKNGAVAAAINIAFLICFTVE